uniref:Uncharacterized protein n=1 Tax=Anopheles quadriannulatus TaxID=34691 RepID=A0A182XTZ1_ANOQN
GKFEVVAALSAALLDRRCNPPRRIVHRFPRTLLTHNGTDNSRHNRVHIDFAHQLDALQRVLQDQNIVVVRVV